MQSLGVFLTLILSVFVGVNRAKVLELSDRFLPLKHEGMWLIKFYAPWCGHCKKLEPIFKHVGQALAQDPVRVGKVDCTRFTSVATEFKIKGFPTIIFLKDGETYTYEGDRTRDDLVAFVKRLMGPPVKEMKNLAKLNEALRTRDINFIYVGEPIGELWDLYYEAAKKYHQHEFFLRTTADILKQYTGEEESEGIRVMKDGTSFKYEEPEDLRDRSQRHAGDDLEKVFESPPPEDDSENKVNITHLSSWISQERFPLFVKITRAKFHHVMSTGKYIVIAVLDENKIGEMTPEMEEFRDMLKSVVERNQDRYRGKFQFGWTGSPDLANSVAMETLSLPNLLVVNSSSYQHHLPDDDPTQLTPEAIQLFLDQILAGEAPVYGGASYTVRLYRAYYEAKSSLSEMWRGNPALTAVLFGLPLGFFALICYSICCADIMDAEEEDEDEEPASPHDKMD